MTSGFLWVASAFLELIYRTENLFTEPIRGQIYGYQRESAGDKLGG